MTAQKFIHTFTSNHFFYIKWMTRYHTTLSIALQGPPCDYTAAAIHFQLVWMQENIYMNQVVLLHSPLAGCPGSSDGKESACDTGDLSLIPASWRFPREGNGNTLQCSCLGIPYTEEPGGLQSTGSQRDGHNWTTNTFTFTFSSVQFCRSVISDSLQSHESQHARPPCPSPTPGVHSNSCPSSQWCHLILCSPLLLLTPIPPSIRVFSSESTLRMRWPKYWSFSFSISLSSEHPGLLSFRMDWLDLLAVQGTLKSLLQHHCSKASILQHSAFFTVQLSNPYMTTGKTIALTRQTFIGKVISLLFNMLSGLGVSNFLA